MIQQNQSPQKCDELKDEQVWAFVGSEAVAGPFNSWEEAQQQFEKLVDEWGVHIYLDWM
ncbi:hypothetical protein [Oceanisphaera psychrotolerans]|uniref:hypothetical protein n=1 Tax=Oceanisphaera psychrotolerans TaxID=1414654 RepID=UPI0015871455|nr:hypothetical protein [Oceanisphaera psychrotolerans]